MLNNQPPPDVPVTNEEMEQAGLGDLSAEFRAYAQNSWFTRAFVKSWDSVWNDEVRQESRTSWEGCCSIFVVNCCRLLKNTRDDIGGEV